MGRPKGGTNKRWSVQEKYEVIKPVVDGKVSAKQRAKDKGIKSPGMIRKWVSEYLGKGIAGLENKRKPGNPLQKYQARKELTEIERLEYEVLKLRIENERLKKGYTTKEADQAKQKKSSTKNMK
ncbi:MAG: helix-turn-helix domain-containing protein [Roseburia sp.]|nr:helix-turn-helix domain-containing protein [Anaeroplasma bactoclasticum]MCM1196877.1 helix-turn-helix domain-containing protein [Roseburia sp.]MCM1556974.1 helix-turn-helix domain-containing protein [Anaeroplasma bactoclasticum]